MTNTLFAFVSGCLCAFGCLYNIYVHVCPFMLIQVYSCSFVIYGAGFMVQTQCKKVICLEVTRLSAPSSRGETAQIGKLSSRRQVGSYGTVQTSQTVSSSENAIKVVKIYENLTSYTFIPL